MRNADKFVEDEKTRLFDKLPKQVQNAFTKLKEYREGREAVAQPYRTAKKAFEDFIKLNPEANWNKTDKDKGQPLKDTRDAAYKKLQNFDKLSKGLEDQLAGLGYGANARKLFAGYAMGGMVYANRGLEIAASKYALGTDTIPAMLTPGEFVMRKSAVDSIGADKLSAMNNGTSIGESVYNYSITVNATGNGLDANDLARQVMEQIKRVDSQRIRSNNY
jgi:hypothetical protein